MGVSLDKSKETPTERPNSGERPPSYNEADPVDQITLALPKLNFNPPSSPISGTVTRDQCVSHLKFLAVLADLRDTISTKNGLFGIDDADADRFSDPTEKDQAHAKIKEKRWAVYVSRAADRYATWFNKCLPPSQKAMTLEVMEDLDYENIVAPSKLLVWSNDTLPPLDILMVWHSHMLNPRNFLEDCLRYGRMSTWHSGFPFEAVNQCIDGRTLDYSPSERCKGNFEKNVKLEWDNLQDPPVKILECPRCSIGTPVMWTHGRFGNSLALAYRKSAGYADNAFEADCQSCAFKITHGRLRVAKFHEDLSHLLYSNEPMPGTLLTANGIPEGLKTRSSYIPHTAMMFPNLMMKAIGKDTASFTSPQTNMCRDIDGLRSHLEPRLRDPKSLAAIGKGRLKPGYKMHFRRMMSRYWDNSSPFALDLVGAVIRQGTFIQKMDKIDWLHSPTVMETAERIIKKYNIFLSIMLGNPNKMAVPTLDVDLAWHTHQLQPYRYYVYTTGLSSGIKRFIDHDDKVEETKLSEAFEWTSKMYRRATNGGIYSECTCWYCEATRAPDLYDRLFNMGSAARARNNADSLHDRRDISSDPDRNPHISAHSAVRPTIDNMPDPQLGTIQHMRLRRNYEKSMRRSEKRGVKRDSRESTDGRYEPMYYSPFVWGYPMYVPYYGPYMCDPGISSDSYAANPGCMSVGSGDVGNCCSGTCGAGVAAGSCGGAGSSAACGSGGCSSSGGCGGGGGGCGGGGGGCGGGGGGGCGGGS